MAQDRQMERQRGHRLMMMVIASQIEDEWMDGWKGRKIKDGWMDGWMGRQIYRQMMGRQINRDGWISRQ